MKTLTVNLPGAAYPIHIGHDILEQHLPRLLEAVSPERVVAITNDTLHRLYPGRIARALEGHPWPVELLTVPDGEQFKTLDTLSTLYDRMMALAATRKTAVVAFGGGVIGDMAGLLAATFMRGIPLIQVPTTLLAQVDSSVGGKTAVNHPRGKNIIGAFKQPEGVVIDLAFLETLPGRELRAGLFELIKHGIIRDAELFDFLESNQAQFGGRNWEFWEEAVFRSCRVKAGVVEKDEKEAGLRAILNFGHTLAHLIETHTGYDQYLHGEAVGVGMLFATFVSRRMDHLGDDAAGRIRSVLEPLIHPVAMPRLDVSAFEGLLMHDKKASAGTLRFILLKALGEAFIREKTEPAELWPLFGDFLAQSPNVLRMKGGSFKSSG